MKILEKIRAASKKAVAARADLQVALEELRNERAAFVHEKNEILSLPTTVEETMNKIKEELDALEAESGNQIQSGQFRSGDPETRFPDLNDIFRVGTGAVGPGGGAIIVRGHNLVGALCNLGLRPLIESSILAKAIAEKPGEGITASERAAKLRKLDADIEAVELAEEKLIRESEEAGISVFRRPDARPEIYLRETV